MDDHSLSGYLKRQSTETLTALLAYCLQKENYGSYSYLISEIRTILQSRCESSAVYK